MGKSLGVWGNTPGSGPGQFDHPEGLAVDGHDNVYVSDAGNSRIQKLAPYGKAFAVWFDDTLIPDDTGVDNGGVAVDAAGDVYVSPGEPGDNIAKLSSSGHVLAVWR